MNARLTRALEKWKSTPVGPLFMETSVPEAVHSTLPVDYLSVVSSHGGHEGCFGENYLRLYRLSEVGAFNVAYEAGELVPQIMLFGSNGGGEAFGFQIEEGGLTVVRIPFIPLVQDYAIQIATDFTSFLEDMAASGEPADVRAEMIGHEIHECHPICMGGDPTNPKNKVLVPAAKHPEVAVFWTKVYVRLRNEQQGN